jgi:site-specific DNA recombinase
MDKLDGLVTGHLVDKLFHPERLAAILTSLTARRAAKEESVSNRIMALQREVTDTDEKLKRLYQLVENGLTDLDDVLKDRLNDLKANRDRAKAALEATKSQIAPNIQLDSALIERFGRSMREKFTSGSIPFRIAVSHRCHRGRRQSDSRQRQQRGPRTRCPCRAGRRTWFADEY